MVKKSLISATMVFGLMGFGSSYLAGQTGCILFQCAIKLGNNSFDSSSWILVNSGTARIIKHSPIVLFGLSGVCLVGAFVTQNDE